MLIMKNNVKKIESTTERTLNRIESYPNYHEIPSRKFSYSFNEVHELAVREETLKIGRRFSFDDNGGGYQGL